MDSMFTQLYSDQITRWPDSGRHILAHYDADSIFIYQAYRSSIAAFAVEHQHFGGDYSFTRMSWIKPNFLWMMYRSGWATKEGQDHILAIRLKRSFFDELLRNAVPSTFDLNRYLSRDAWKSEVDHSEVRLQWDPDHDPTGSPVNRRAVQLGLRGQTLRRFGASELISIEDITPFVIEQRSNLSAGLDRLFTPREAVYLPSDHAAAQAVCIDTFLF